MNELPSQSSQAINCATSSGWPFLFIAQVASRSLPLSSFAALCISVSMIPLCNADQLYALETMYWWTHGDMQFTLIPLSPTSFAAVLESPMTACCWLSAIVSILTERTSHAFDAEYAPTCADPAIPAILEALTMLPFSFIFWICARMQYITRITVNSITNDGRAVKH